MAITFVGGATGNNNNGSDATVTLPASLQNDLVIAALSIPRTTDLVMAMTTTGYTQVADLYASDIRDSNFGVFYKFMGASPDATAVGTGSGNVSDGVAMACMVFRGVKLVADGGPFDVASTTATGTNASEPDPPSIDWSTSGVWTVAAGGGSVLTVVSNPNYTGPTGYTTNFQTTAGDDSLDCLVGLGYNSSPSDPENPGLMTVVTTSIDDAWSACTMALVPAAGGGAGGAFTGWGIPIF